MMRRVVQVMLAMVVAAGSGGCAAFQSKDSKREKGPLNLEGIAPVPTDEPGETKDPHGIAVAGHFTSYSSSVATSEFLIIGVTTQDGDERHHYTAHVTPQFPTGNPKTTTVSVDYPSGVLTFDEGWVDTCGIQPAVKGHRIRAVGQGTHFVFEIAEGRERIYFIPCGAASKVVLYVDNDKFGEIDTAGHFVEIETNATEMPQPQPIEQNSQRLNFIRFVKERTRRNASDLVPWPADWPPAPAGTAP